MDASITLNAIIANYRKNDNCSDATLAAMVEEWAAEVRQPALLFAEEGLYLPLGMLGESGVAGLQSVPERFEKGNPPSLNGDRFQAIPARCPDCQGGGFWSKLNGIRCATCRGTGLAP